MNYRTLLIKIFTFLGGLYFFAEFFLPKSFYGLELSKYDQQISLGFQAIGGLTFGLGLINIVMYHGARLVFVKKGAINSLALLLGMLIMFGVTYRDWSYTQSMAASQAKFFSLRDFAERIKTDLEQKKSEVPPLATRQEKLSKAIITEVSLTRTELARLPGPAPESAAFDAFARYSPALISKLAELETAAIALNEPSNLGRIESNPQIAGLLGEVGAVWGDVLNLSYESSTPRKMYQFCFEGLFNSLGSAMFSLLGFYIASAAYRAFRVRSLESGLMMLAALIVMLGQISFGAWISEHMPDLRLWLLRVPNAGAFRAIAFGAAIASLVVAFRMWLSIESGSFSQKDRR